MSKSSTGKSSRWGETKANKKNGGPTQEPPNKKGKNIMLNLQDEVIVLKEYIDWYNNHPEITREELYRSYYGERYYKPWMRKGQLDKYLTR